MKLMAASRLRAAIEVTEKPEFDRLEFLNVGDVVKEGKAVSREDIDDKWKTMIMLTVKKVDHWVPLSDWKKFKESLTTRKAEAKS